MVELDHVYLTLAVLEQLAVIGQLAVIEQL